MPLSSDLREFIALLNSNEVEYLIVGAFALAYHGYPRYTGDLDIFLRASAENAARVIQSLTQFGFESMGITAADIQMCEQVIQLGVAPHRIDLLTSISGVKFEDAWLTRCDGEMDGTRAHFIGVDELIQNKKKTGRARDLGDAEELRKRKRGAAPNSKRKQNP